MTTQFQSLPDTLDLGHLRVTSAMVELYAVLTTDYNPIHLDADFAAGTPFGKPIIHGTMGLNFLVEGLHTAFNDRFPEMRIDVRFVRPVNIGTTIRAGGKLKDATTHSYEVFVETESGERAVEGTCSFGPPAIFDERNAIDPNGPKDTQ